MVLALSIKLGANIKKVPFSAMPQPSLTEVLSTIYDSFNLGECIATFADDFGNLHTLDDLYLPWALEIMARGQSLELVLTKVHAKKSEEKCEVVTCSFTEDEACAQNFPCTSFMCPGKGGKGWQKGGLGKGFQCGNNYPYASQFYSAAMQSTHQAMPVPGEFMKLLKTQQGSLHVQQTFTDTACNEQRLALALELRTHVWEALRDPHANWFLAQCIIDLPPTHLQFVIDEIRGRAPKAATHQCGCRILERLIEHFEVDKVQVLVEELLLVAPKLSTQDYGSKVLQHLFEHGSPSQIVSLANALLSQPNLLKSMAHSRHGSVLIRLALQEAEEPQVRAARDALLATEAKPEKGKNGRYARNVLRALQGNAEQVLGDEDEAVATVSSEDDQNVLSEDRPVNLPYEQVLRDALTVKNTFYQCIFEESQPERRNKTAPPRVQEQGDDEGVPLLLGGHDE